MGMLETNTLEAHDRDTGKDHLGGARNVSFLNLCVDLIYQLGYNESERVDLNGD